MNRIDLDSWGWRPEFQTAMEPFAEQGLAAARVLRQDRDQYTLVAEGGFFAGVALGRLADDDAGLPAVGDWVAVAILGGDQAAIHAVLPRFSAFMRKQAGARSRPQVVATNVDTAFLVSGLDHDFNPRRIERYVLQSAASGTRPVIVLNKADIASAPDALERAREVSAGAEVVLVSAIAPDGLAPLRPWLRKGETVVLLGSSGAGKSTIINRILGSEAQATGEVRVHDSHGRHVTTRRELFKAPEGFLLIDTPGLREIQLWADEVDVAAAFPDIQSLAAECRYRDCAHKAEPGCAVRAAIGSGSLSPGRLRGYRRLSEEQAALDERRQESMHRDKRKREKQMSKLIKRLPHDLPKRRG